MVVVVPHYLLEEDEVLVRYSLKHEQPIVRVVEQTARFTGGALTLETGNFAHVEITKQLLRPDTLQVAARRYPIEAPYQVEHPRAEIVELVLYFVARAALHHRFELISVLALKLVLSQLIDLVEHHGMDALPDTEQHVQHQVPVVISEVNESLIFGIVHPSDSHLVQGLVSVRF